MRVRDNHDVHEFWARGGGGGDPGERGFGSFGDGVPSGWSLLLAGAGNAHAASCARGSLLAFGVTRRRRDWGWGGRPGLKAKHVHRVREGTGQNGHVLLSGPASAARLCGESGRSPSQAVVQTPSDELSRRLLCCDATAEPSSRPSDPAFHAGRGRERSHVVGRRTIVPASSGGWNPRCGCVSAVAWRTRDFS